MPSKSISSSVDPGSLPTAVMSRSWLDFLAKCIYLITCNPALRNSGHVGKTLNLVHAILRISWSDLICLRNLRRSFGSQHAGRCWMDAAMNSIVACYTRLRCTKVRWRCRFRLYFLRLPGLIGRLGMSDPRDRSSAVCEDARQVLTRRARCFPG